MVLVVSFYWKGSMRDGFASSFTSTRAKRTSRCSTNHNVSNAEGLFGDIVADSLGYNDTVAPSIRL